MSQPVLYLSELMFFKTPPACEVRSTSLKAIALVCLIAASLSAVGCATTSKAPRSVSEEVTTPPPTSKLALRAETIELLHAIVISPSQLPSLESLEESENLIAAAASPEHRALALSELWFNRAQALARSSRTGSLASFLRAAELSLAALLGDGCSTVFNPACVTLGVQYMAATRAVVTRLQQSGWEAPPLATSHYDLTLRGANGPLFLRDWSLTIPDHTAQNGSAGGVRAGIGFAAAGCRVFALSANSVGVCAPLTFVLSFSGPTTASLRGDYESKTEAVLSVYDGYQRERVSLNGQSVPLAADFGSVGAQAAQFAAAQRAEAKSTAEPNNLIPLSCVSIPSSATETVVLVGSEKALRRYQDSFAQFVGDAALRARFSFCRYTAQKQADPASLGSDLSLLIAPDAATNFLPRSAAVTFVALDAVGQRHTAQSARLLQRRPTALKLSAVISVVSSQAQRKQAEKLSHQLAASDGVTATTVQLTQKEGVATSRQTSEALRKALLELPERGLRRDNLASPPSSQPPPAPEDPLAPEADDELPVSPVL
jgi:hypothetical protein